jgi:hypothetical protein
MYLSPGRGAMLVVEISKEKTRQPRRGDMCRLRITCRSYGAKSPL